MRTTIYQIRQTGKKDKIGEIKYNVYEYIKAGELDIRIHGKNIFLTSYSKVSDESFNIFWQLEFEMSERSAVPFRH